MKKIYTLLVIALLLCMLGGCGGASRAALSDADTVATSEKSNDKITLELCFEGDIEKNISSFQCSLYLEEDQLLLTKEFTVAEIQDNSCRIELDRSLLQGQTVIRAEYTVDGKYSFGSAYGTESDVKLSVVITYSEEDDCYYSVLAG